MKKYFSQVFILLAMVVFAMFSNNHIAYASGTLAVTGVSSVKLTGVANNTYDDGWRWIFHITLPSDENLVSMRFTDFSNGSQTIPASNIRLFSEQSTNSYNQVTAMVIPGALVYSDNIIINPSSDLNPALDGTQIDITVETRIPFGITGSGYNTNYDVASDAPEVTPPDYTPESEVYATTTQIVSGLCFFLDRPYKDSPYRANISSGNIKLGTTTRLYPGTFMAPPSVSNLKSFGYDWLVYVNVFPNVVNGYSMTTYPETRSPSLLASTTLVGRIKFDTARNVIFIESANPDCQKVEIGNFSKPIIISDAPKEITHYVGMLFSDPVATAWDSIDGDITSKMVYSENLDLWTPGDYKIDINVTNSSGYMADTFTQILHIIPLTPQMIAYNELTELIKSLEWGLDNRPDIKIGNEPGEYTQQNLDLLLLAINAAKTVRDNPNASLQDLLDAKASLLNSATLFNSSRNQ